LHDKVHYAATPDYGIEGCPPGYYKSIFVSGKEQSLGSSARGIFAFNDAHSQLGWAGPIDAREKLALTPKRFLKTGSHLNSAKAMSQAHADSAALDTHSWSITLQYNVFAKRLVMIGQTDPISDLPDIFSKKHSPNLVFDTCIVGLKHLQKHLKHKLGLHGFVRLAKNNYINVPNPIATANLT
jgi:hypothetical protein